MCHYWYLFGLKLSPNLELTSNSPYSAFCFKWYLTWPFFRSKTYMKFLGKKSSIYNWLPRYIPAWLYRQFQHSPKKIYFYSLSLRSAEQKNISVSIGNHMIWNHLITYTFFSSAIWNKQARVNFSKTNKSARARRASALCGLWKIYKCLFIPNCTRKIMWLLINNIHVEHNYNNKFQRIISWGYLHVGYAQVVMNMAP